MYPAHRIPSAFGVVAIFLMGCNPLSSDQTAGTDPTSASAPAMAVASDRPTSAPPAPSVAEEARVPAPPVEFTGTLACGPPVRSATQETLDVGDDGMVLSMDRSGAWRQTVTMSDPRLEGSIHHTYESDVYRAAGANADGPTVTAFTWRIRNDGGTWETRGNAATFPDGSPIGDSSGFYVPSRVFVGSGGYEGLVAILEVTEERDQGCVADVRGIIFEGAPVPEPYIAE